MKQTIYTKLLRPCVDALLALPILVSCSSDDTNVASDTPREQPITISSNLTEAVMTRGTIEAYTTQGDNKVFTVDLSVDLFISEDVGNPPVYQGEVNFLKTTAPTGDGAAGVGNFSWYNNSGRTGDAIPKYWPSSGNALYFLAYYPANAITGPVFIDTDTPQTFTCATDQGAANGALAYDLMFGAPATNPVPRANAADPVTLAFKHCLSKVVVSIDKDGTSLTDNNELNGATITLGNSDMYNQADITPNTGAASTTGSADQTFTLKAADNTGLTNYCIIPPQTLTGKTITITLAGGAVATYVIPQFDPGTGAIDVTTEPGKVYTYTFTLGLTTGAANMTITDWTEGLNHADNINARQP
jgi:hypothetical protein